MDAKLEQKARELIDADKEYEDARRNWDRAIAGDPTEMPGDEWERVSTRFENAVMDRIDKRNELEAAITAWNARALQAQPAEGEKWRPIETAPLDGTTVLTCILSENAPYPVEVKLNFYNDPTSVAPGYSLGSKSWWCSAPSKQPTHWAPLPRKGDK